MGKIKGTVISSERVSLANDNYYFLKISDNPEKDKKELVLVVNAQGYDYTVDDVKEIYSRFYPDEKVFALNVASSIRGTGFNPSVYEKVIPVESLLEDD